MLTKMQISLTLKQILHSLQSAQRFEGNNWN